MLARSWEECVSGISWASLVAQVVKHLPTMQETQVRSLGQEDPLEKEMATHSSTLAWKIPRVEEPGRLQPMGSQRVRYDQATSLSFFLVTSYMIIKRWPWLPGLPWLYFHFVRERLWFLWVHCCFIPSLRALCPNASVCGCSPESPVLGSFNPFAWLCISYDYVPANTNHRAKHQPSEDTPSALKKLRQRRWSTNRNRDDLLWSELSDRNGLKVEDCRTAPPFALFNDCLWLSNSGLQQCFIIKSYHLACKLLICSFHLCKIQQYKILLILYHWSHMFSVRWK